MPLSRRCLLRRCFAADAAAALRSIISPFFAADARIAAIIHAIFLFFATRFAIISMMIFHYAIFAATPPRRLSARFAG
jgi:uncharacterized membrane protein